MFDEPLLSPGTPRHVACFVPALEGKADGHFSKHQCEVTHGVQECGPLQAGAAFDWNLQVAPKTFSGSMAWLRLLGNRMTWPL